jgi:hypothetical protein
MAVAIYQTRTRMTTHNPGAKASLYLVQNGGMIGGFWKHGDNKVPAFESYQRAHLAIVEVLLG